MAKITVETKANLTNDQVFLDKRGSFFVCFTPGSEIGRILDVKQNQKFKVTIERVK